MKQKLATLFLMVFCVSSYAQRIPNPTTQEEKDYNECFRTCRCVVDKKYLHYNIDLFDYKFLDKSGILGAMESQVDEILNLFKSQYRGLSSSQWNKIKSGIDYTEYLYRGGKVMKDNLFDSKKKRTDDNKECIYNIGKKFGRHVALQIFLMIQYESKNKQVFTLGHILGTWNVKGKEPKKFRFTQYNVYAKYFLINGGFYTGRIQFPNDGYHKTSKHRINEIRHIYEDGRNKSAGRYRLRLTKENIYVEEGREPEFIGKYIFVWPRHDGKIDSGISEGKEEYINYYVLEILSAGETSTQKTLKIKDKFGNIFDLYRKKHITQNKG